MGGCISTMPRRPRSSRFRPSPQVQFPDSVKIQRYEYPSSAYSYPPSPYDGGGLVTDGKKSDRTGNFSQRVPPCPPHYKESSSGTTAPLAASSTNENEICSTCERKVYHCPHCQTPILTKVKLICGDEKFWCPICLANPEGMAFGCGHLTCLECAQDLQSCPKCGSLGTSMQLY